MVSASGNTVGAYILRHCEFYSELPALRFLRDGRRKEIRYGQLRELAMELGVGLRLLGLSPGDRVAIVGGATPEWILALAAIQVAGLVDVSYDEQADPGRISSVLQETESRVLFSENEHLLQSMARLSPETRCIHLSWRNFREHRTAGLRQSLADLQRRGRTPGGRILATEALRGRMIDDPASILYKRPDRTNRSRAVVLTHRNILANLESFASTLALSEGDDLQLGFPLWHSAGRFAFYFTLRNSATLCLSGRASFADDLQRYRPTVALADAEQWQQFYARVEFGHPEERLQGLFLRRLYLRISALWNRLTGFIFEEKSEPGQGTSPANWLALFFVIPALILVFPLKAAGDFRFRRAIYRRLGGRLRVILTGGSAVSRRLDQLFQTIGVPLLAGYWLTEAAHIAACRRLVWTGQRSRLTPGTVGPILPGTALRLVDHRGEDVSNIVGAIGEVYLQGQHIMQGYFRNPLLTAEVLDDQGWLRTGDRGRLTASGDLVLLPRQSRLDAL